MSRAIHCTVVEVPEMSDVLGSHAGGFEDLVPWADPYIAALIEKLRQECRDEEVLLHMEDYASADMAAELPPPLESDNPSDAEWHADWSSRNWPRR